MESFGARLTARVADRESQIVLGLDPDPAALWPGSWDGLTATGTAARAASAVEAHCRAVIAEAGPAAVAVKLQLACFERLGAAGWQALAAVTVAAQTAGLLVIADGKRADIDVSAAAYAQALLGSVPTPEGDVGGLGADAVTVAPYMGPDTIAPFARSAADAGAGLFVLVRTSNPGAAVIEDALLADGRRVWEAVAAMVSEVSGPVGGRLADVGAVFGATAPDQLERARELLPHAPFLLPGVGAQGGSVAGLAPAFAPGRAGGLVTVSRSIVGKGPGQARAAAEALREQAWALPHG